MNSERKPVTPKSIIAYDKDLPEIPGRRPWERPTSFLVKDPTAASGWRAAGAGFPTVLRFLSVGHYVPSPYLHACSIIDRIRPSAPRTAPHGASRAPCPQR